MSELLDSVRRSFYHDVLSFSDAEAVLEGKPAAGAYLFRESDVKSGMFVISYVKNSSVPHSHPEKRWEVLHTNCR